MANISTLLETIKDAVYGRDMRQALHDSIKAVNDDVNKFVVNGEAFEQKVNPESDYIFTAINSPITSSDTIRRAFEKAQGQIDNLNERISGQGATYNQTIGSPYITFVPINEKIQNTDTINMAFRKTQGQIDSLESDIGNLSLRVEETESDIVELLTTLNTDLSSMNASIDALNNNIIVLEAMMNEGFVEKSGDTMTGNLSMGTYKFIVENIDSFNGTIEINGDVNMGANNFTISYINAFGSEPIGISGDVAISGEVSINDDYNLNITGELTTTSILIKDTLTCNGSMSCNALSADEGISASIANFGEVKITSGINGLIYMKEVDKNAGITTEAGYSTEEINYLNNNSLQAIIIDLLRKYNSIGTTGGITSMTPITESEIDAAFEEN